MKGTPTVNFKSGVGKTTISIFFAIASLVFSSSVSYSQTVKGYGVKLGAVSARQIWEPYNQFPDYRWGLNAGLFIEFLDLRNVGVLMEWHFIQKGAEQSFRETTPAQPEGTGRYLTYDERLDYFSMPLLLKLRIDSTSVEPYVLMGPQVDILIGKKGYTPMLIENFRDIEWGGTLGMGLEIRRLLPLNLMIEFRYNPSFTRAYEKNSMTMVNKTFQILLGLGF